MENADGTHQEIGADSHLSDRIHVSTTLLIEADHKKTHRFPKAVSSARVCVSHCTSTDNTSNDPEQAKRPVGNPQLQQAKSRIEF